MVTFGTSETVKGKTVKELDSLIEAVAKGDRNAFEELYQSMIVSVYAYALSVLKNRADAEDVAHDCFVKIYTAAAFFRKKQRAKAWILTIARNLCMQKFRQRRKTLELDPEADYTEQSEGASPEDKIVLEQCLNRLTLEERQIVVLHAVSGFRHREIAATLELPLPTVLSKYSRAIKKLREFYHGEKSNEKKRT